MLCLISISSISAADYSGADTVSILDGGADGSVIGDAASRLDDVSSADESSAIADSESGSIDSASSSDSTLATDNSSSSTNASSTVAVNKKATKLTASSYTYKYARKTLTLKAKLVNYQGKALSGKKIKFRFNGMLKLAQMDGLLSKSKFLQKRIIPIMPLMQVPAITKRQKTQAN